MTGDTKDEGSAGRYGAAWWAAVRQDLEADRADERRRWGGLDEETLACYVAGTCTPEERARVEQAMRDSSDVRECVEGISESPESGRSARSGEAAGSARRWIERADRGSDGMGRTP
jgi:ribosomal protein L37AE/L43A